MRISENLHLICVAGWNATADQRGLFPTTISALLSLRSSVSSTPIHIMPTYPRLPREVWGRIAGCLAGDSDRNALCKLALTSSYFADDCQQILFRCLDFEDGDRKRPWNSREVHRLFLLAILASPDRLAKYVRTYTSACMTIAPSGGVMHSVRSITNAGSRSMIHGTEAAMELWNVTFAALPLMINLEHLTFGSYGLQSDSIRASACILRSCFFSLKTLTWGNPADSAELCTDFLPRQPLLQALTIRDFSEPSNPINPKIPAVHSSLLPRLKSLNAPTNVMLALLPGRDINAASWNLTMERVISVHGNHERVASAQDMARALKDTRYLSLSDIKCLKEIGNEMPSVEVLNLNCYDWDWVRPFIMDRHSADITLASAQGQGRQLRIQQDVPMGRIEKILLPAGANFAPRRRGQRTRSRLLEILQRHLHPQSVAGLSNPRPCARSIRL